MKYETAKKLKDAGFPQSGDGDFCLGSIEEDQGGITTTNSVYIPTLEELIDACGEEFWNLTYSRKEKGWSAESFEAATATISGTIFLDTPSEAVANLYLALNKKS